MSTCCACWRAEPHDQRRGSRRATRRSRRRCWRHRRRRPGAPDPVPAPATAASASGKLAPQRIAPGSTTQRQRTISSWKLNQGSFEIDGLIGQYGSDSVSMYAAQAIAPQSSI